MEKTDRSPQWTCFTSWLLARWHSREVEVQQLISPMQHRCQAICLSQSNFIWSQTDCLIMGDYVPVCVRIQKWRLNYLITLIDLFKSTKSRPICLCELQHSVAFFALWNVSGLGSFRRFRHSDDLSNPSVQFKYQKALFYRATAGVTRCARNSAIRGEL